MQSRIFKHLKWIGPLVLVVGGVWILVQGLGKSRVTAEEIVHGMKSKMSLPMTVDEITRLDDIEAAPRRIRYLLTITEPVRLEAERESMILGLKKQISGGACANPNYQLILKDGISIESVYKFLDGPAYPGIVVAPEDCEVPATFPKN